MGVGRLRIRGQHGAAARVGCPVQRPQRLTHGLAGPAVPLACVGRAPDGVLQLLGRVVLLLLGRGDLIQRRETGLLGIGLRLGFLRLLPPGVAGGCGPSRLTCNTFSRPGCGQCRGRHLLGVPCLLGQHLQRAAAPRGCRVQGLQCLRQPAFGQVDVLSGPVAGLLQRPEKALPPLAGLLPPGGGGEPVPLHRGGVHPGASARGFLACPVQCPLRLVELLLQVGYVLEPGAFAGTSPDEPRLVAGRCDRGRHRDRDLIARRRVQGNRPQQLVDPLGGDPALRVGPKHVRQTRPRHRRSSRSQGHIPCHRLPVGTHQCVQQATDQQSTLEAISSLVRQVSGEVH